MHEEHNEERNDGLISGSGESVRHGAKNAPSELARGRKSLLKARGHSDAHLGNKSRICPAPASDLI